MTKKGRTINWRNAIGEIIIVSIGILIAFGINTCSSNFSTQKKYNEYRTSLIIDINENLKNIDRIIAAQKTKVTELNAVIEKIERNELDTQFISDILFRQRKSPTFFPVSGTFKALVSQGEIEAFSTELKRELFNLYDTSYERTVYNGNLYDNIYVEVYDKEVHDILDIRNKKIENIQRLKSKAFIKHLMLIVDEAKSYLSLLDNSKEESVQLIRLIESD